MAETSIKAVIDYFRLPGDTLKGLADEWKQLTEADKDQLRQGIGDGSLTY